MQPNWIRTAFSVLGFPFWVTSANPNLGLWRACLDSQFASTGPFLARNVGVRARVFPLNLTSPIVAEGRGVCAWVRVFASTSPVLASVCGLCVWVGGLP